MTGQNAISHAVDSTNLADLIERILDKGIVVAGDINIRIVDVELLTIQLRLVVCSVDRAIELGFDWWNRERRAVQKPDGEAAQLTDFDQRLARIEEALARIAERGADKEEMMRHEQG